VPHVSLERLVNTVTTRLPGSTAMAVQLELFVVLDEFLQDSGAWTDKVTFNPSATATEYNLAVTAGQIVRLKGVVTADKAAVAATMAIPGVIELHAPVGAGQGSLTAEFVLTVADPVTRDMYPLVPTWITTRYNGDLIDGLLGRMMSQPSKPYTNEQLAVYHLRRFRNAISKARADALLANTEGAQAWRFPQGFAVRRQ
jgi:hypothetical protein